jgi:hypothetical protein
MSVKLTIRTIGKRVEYAIENNIKLAQSGKIPVAYNIEGPAGAGKTSIIKQLAGQLDMPFIRLDLSSITVDDLIGMPFKQVEICNSDTLECVWVNEREVDHYFKQNYTPTNNSRTSYALPKWFKSVEGDNPVILYLDDFTRAPLQVIQACMSIIDEQRFNTFTLPAGSTVLLSSNPEVDDSGQFYSVTSLDGAHNTRYLTLKCKFDLDEWVEDFGEKNVDGRLINFLLSNPEIVSGIKITNNDGETIKKSPIRLWTKFADAISNIKDFEKEASLEMISDFGSCLPQEHIMMFTQFIANKLDKIPTPKEIVDDFNAEDTLYKLIFKDNKQSANASIASILQKRLCAYALNYQHELKPNELDKIINIIFSNSKKLFSKDLTHIAATKLVSVKGVTKNQHVMKIIAEQYKS